MDHVNNTTEKKQRGRPPKPKIATTEEVKRPRGRPRKNPEEPKNEIKRGIGRPRKYQVLEKERTNTGEVRPVFKKVDNNYLMKRLMNYFTRLLVLHNELSNEPGARREVFNRLKSLDFQMAEICKSVLSSEYSQVAATENTETSSIFVEENQVA